MRRIRTGLGAFGKGFIAPPPTQPINVTVQAPPGQAPIIQGATSAEMALLRAELDALKLQRQQVAAAGPQGVDQAALVAQSGLTLPGTPTRGGTVVEGSGGQTQREVLSTPGQTFFTRTTDEKDANLRWDDWNRLKTMLPAAFNEERYLAKYPDVAEAVRSGAMPSGAWHYVMYGMPNCQYGAKNGSKCDVRSFEGWRRALSGLGGYRPQPRRASRPGYLSGYKPWK